MTKSLSRVACTAAFAATTLFLGVCAYLRMFTSFAFWDDEGCLLVSLKSFHDGGRLYDEVYSQYGPFHYQMMGGLFSALRHPVTHDAGRLISLSVWLALSFVCGLLVFRLTRSLWLGIGVQMLALKSLLHTLCLEPMHPGGLVCLRPLPDTALLKYLNDGFVPLEERGGYQILVRRSS